MNQNKLFMESLVGIFTANQGKIKLLLMRKKSEPYKGYWVLPGEFLKIDESLEENVSRVINQLGLPDMYFEQVNTFSDVSHYEKSRVVATSYLALVDIMTLKLKQEERKVEMEWFDINEIPKLGYDHNLIVSELIKTLKQRIINSNILKILFPSDFALPELQKIYESVLNIKIDRRNFRKMLINLGYIIPTGELNEGYTGRPAKLYRFNEEKEERNLF